MPLVRWIMPVLLLALVQWAAPQTPAAEAIMARVAGNQDRAEAERSRYVHTQHARVYSRKGPT